MRFSPKAGLTPSYHIDALTVSYSCLKIPNIYENCLLVFFTKIFPVKELEVWETVFEAMLVPLLFCNHSHQNPNQYLPSENLRSSSIAATTEPLKMEDQFSG